MDVQTVTDVQVQETPDLKVQEPTGLSEQEIQVSRLEDCAFSPEFLSVLLETGFEALETHLKQTGAPPAALELLENIQVIQIWSSEITTDGKINWIGNQAIEEAVSQVSRNIAEIGGVFYSRSGTTVPRTESA